MCVKSHISWPPSRAGFSLIAVIAGFAIVSVAIVAYMQISGVFSKSAGTLDRGVLGHQVLTQVGLDIQQMDFSQIGTLCTTKDSFTADKVGQCVDSSGHLNDLANQTQPVGDAPKLDVRLAFDGSIAADGNTCVELTRCTFRAGGTTLEMRITLIQKDVAPDKPLIRKTMILRRVRW